MTFTSEHTPADIVKTYPQASDLFKKRKIDFCCGGDKPLHLVFEKKKLNSEEVLDELNTAFDEWKANGNVEIDWSSISNSELIDHIMDRHHAYLNEELPALGQFVTKITRVHGEKHPHLQELYDLYDSFQTELEAHLLEEETELFPLIRKYEQQPDSGLLDQINELNKNAEAEHQQTGDLLRQINSITNGFNPPEDACNSYRITYARLAELESNTFQHIHLENNILFKNFN